MSNITRIPVQDNYQSKLTAKLIADAMALTVYVKVTPDYTPTTTDTRIVINPGKDNAEVMLVDSYDATAKTFTIAASGRAQPLYIGDTGTLQEHASGSIVMISDNYGFWKEIQDSVNTKANADIGVFTTSLKEPVYADATARDAAIPSPANGMVVYLTSPGQFYDYVGGSWQARASGTNPNASETVAGKTQLATDAEFAAGTQIGSTGAYLVPKNSQIGGGLSNPIVTALEPISIGMPVTTTSTSSSVENLISSQFSSGDAGTQTAFQVGTVGNIFSFGAGQDRTIQLFIEGGNLKAVVNYTAPTTKTPTPGAVQTIASSVAAVLPSGCSMDNNTVVITFVDGSNDLKSLSATFANATTTVLVPQAEQLVKTGTVTGHSTAKGNTDKLVYVFQNATGNGITTIGTLDPTTRALTVAVANEQALFAANAISQISSCNAGTDKVFTVFRDDTSGDCTQVAISCGTTTPVPGSPVTIDGNNSTSMDCTYLASDTILVVRRDTTVPSTKAKVASISGVTVTNPGTELTVSTIASADSACTYALSSSEAVVAWRDITNSKGTFQPISITGTTPALVGAPVDFAATAIADATLSIAPVNLNKKIAFAYSLSGDGDGYSRIYQNYNNTNKYIGIAQSTVATADSVTIKQVGIDTNQTGLTPGAIVFSNGIPIGKALTATSMEVVVPKGSVFGVDLYSADLGNTDDYVVNLNPAPTAYTTGMQVTFKATTANTGAATLNVNGLGAKAIVKNYNVALATGDILAGQLVSLEYDSTGGNFQMMSPVANILIGNKLSVLTTPVTGITNTGATITTFTVPGGTLSTNNAIKASMYLSSFSTDNASRNYTITVQYGSTTVSTTLNANLFGATFKGWVDIIFSAAGTTSSQYLGLRMSVSADPSTIYIKSGSGSYAIDSTIDKTFTITGATSASNNWFDVSACVVELIN